MIIWGSIDIPQPSVPLQTRALQEWIALLSESWFSKKLSAEEMMSGTSNETSVPHYIGKRPRIRFLFENGILESKSETYMACYPDGDLVLGFRKNP